MKLDQLAGLYFLGTEDYNASNCMIATVVLKEKINYQMLFPSYRRLIVGHPLLQTKIIEQSEKNRFCWGSFTNDEIERRLDFERNQLASKFNKPSILHQYYPTNTRLPFHITVVDDFTLVVCMHHAIANGKCFVFWIQKWLQYYAQGHVTPEGHTADQGRRKKIVPRLKRFYAYLWLPLFLSGFFLRAGKTSPKDTIDLSHGTRPARNRQYFTKSYCLDRKDTKRLLQRCRLARMTLTEHMCVVLTRELFHAFPEKRRAFFSIPMDMHAFLPYSPEHTRGNIIASLPAQFFRGKDLSKQVKSVFKWFKRGVPYSLACLFAAVSKSYEKSKAKCLTLSKMPIPDRSPLWDFTLTYSNLGVIRHPLMDQLVDAIYFSFKSQSILLVSATISGKMYIELSFSRDLYQPDEIIGLFDRVLSIDHLMK